MSGFRTELILVFEQSSYYTSSIATPVLFLIMEIYWKSEQLKNINNE